MIPPVLHQVWVGGPLPDHLAGYTAGLRAMHPDWEYRLWDEAAVAQLGLINQHLWDDADRLAGQYAGQFRSDVARLEILWRLGGVYVDTDCEARRPLDPLLDDLCFLGWEVEGVWVNNAVVGAVRGHPLLQQLVAQLPAHVRRFRPPARPNRMSGPRYVTPRARAAHVTLHPQHFFYPYLHDELHRDAEPHPDSYLVHHWDNARKRKGHPRSWTSHPLTPSEG